jgi:hypothetical protein
MGTQVFNPGSQSSSSIAVIIQRFTRPNISLAATTPEADA